MVKLEKYIGTKTYMFPNGALATPDTIKAQFPAVEHFPHIIEVNGDVCQAVMNLNAMRQIHNINSALSEDEAIAAIETVINTPPEIEIDVNERIASALEFQNLMSMEDIII